MTTFKSRMPQWKHDKAKEMRKNPTPTEATVWQMLKSRRLGVKFRRQQLMFGYILDFWCPSLRLVIEVDGPIHDAEYDQRRDEHLRKGFPGITILRIPTSDLEADRDAVRWKILEEIRSLESGDRDRVRGGSPVLEEVPLNCPACGGSPVIYWKRFPEHKRQPSLHLRADCADCGQYLRMAPRSFARFAVNTKETALIGRGTKLNTLLPVGEAVDTERPNNLSESAGRSQA